MVLLLVEVAIAEVAIVATVLIVSALVLVIIVAKTISISSSSSSCCCCRCSGISIIHSISISRNNRCCCGLVSTGSQLKPVSIRVMLHLILVTCVGALGLVHLVQISTFAFEFVSTLFQQIYNIEWRHLLPETCRYSRVLVRYSVHSNAEHVHNL